MNYAMPSKEGFCGVYDICLKIVIKLEFVNNLIDNLV